VGAKQQAERLRGLPNRSIPVTNFGPLSQKKALWDREIDCLFLIQTRLTSYDASVLISLRETYIYLKN
jgi:hypothetical protein